MLGEGRVLYLDRDMSFVHDSASVMHCSLTAVAAVADQHGGRKSLTKKIVAKIQYVFSRGSTNSLPES